MSVSLDAVLQVCAADLSDCVYVRVGDLPYGFLPPLSTSDALLISAAFGALMASVWLWKVMPR